MDNFAQNPTEPLEGEVLQPEEKNDGLFSQEDMAILKRNQKLRLMVIDSLTSEGKQVPGDKMDRAFLAKMMEDLDGEIHGRTRIKVAAKTEAAMGNLAEVVGRAMADLKVESAGAIPASPQQLSEVPSHVPPARFVKGQLDQGSIPVKMEEIIPPKVTS